MRLCRLIGEVLMTDSYRLPHNIIKLRLPDGRVVSMIQDQATVRAGLWVSTEKP